MVANCLDFLYVDRQLPEAVGCLPSEAVGCLPAEAVGCLPTEAVGVQFLDTSTLPLTVSDRKDIFFI